MLLTTSLTPRFRHLASEARRTSLRVLLQSFLPASGFAMGASATGVFFFSVSVSLPIAAAAAFD
uniref:Pco076082 n=1 Tax=Arundo donax TaxID=35708 RepID=A0A0A9E994_ARUDO